MRLTAFADPSVESGSAFSYLIGKESGEEEEYVEIGSSGWSGGGGLSASV